MSAAHSSADAPVFPLPGQDGMTLREWYAGLAMHAILSRCGPMTGDNAAPDSMPMASENAPTTDQVADYAFEQADAMLVRREC